MARTKGSGLDLTEVLCTRVTAKEKAQIDAIRRSLSRTQWMRWLIVKELRNHQEQ